MLRLDDPHGVRVILFDAVGTLLRPSPPVAEAYHAAALHFGSTKSVEEIQQRFQHAMRRYAACGVIPITEFGPRCPGHPVALTTNEARELQRWRSIVTYVFDDVATNSNELFESLWKHFASSGSWQLFDDVVPAWQSLSAKGFQLGLASNFDARLVGLCHALPPLNEAAFCFVSSKLKYPKPHPRFYEAIQEQLELEPHQLLLVGDDRVNDYEAPRAAGWQAVYLCRGGHKERDAIASLDQLPELLA